MMGAPLRERRGVLHFCFRARGHSDGVGFGIMVGNIVHRRKRHGERSLLVVGFHTTGK